MAMEDPRLLLPTNMSFNPFRSSSSYQQSAVSHQPQQQRRIDDPTNDSWHTNRPDSPDDSFRRIDSTNNDEVVSQPSFEPPSSAFTWLSSQVTSWATTSSSTKDVPPPSRTASVSTAKISNAPKLSASMPLPSTRIPSSSHHHAPLSSQLSPAKSMTMNRGLISPPGSEQSPQTSNIHHDHNIPPPPLHNKEPSPANIGGGCLQIQQNGKISSPLRRLSLPEELSSSVVENNVVKYDLPPYPEIKALGSQTTQSTKIKNPQRNGPLLHEFPCTTPKLATKSAKVASPSATSRNATSPKSAKKSPFIPKEETTFPGFALFQTTKAHYCLGRYSEALDATTECLALQKLALSGGGSSASAQAAMVSSKESSKKSPKLGPRVADATPASSSGGIVDVSVGSMTALDLRSTFATSVGSSVRGVVQSFKDSAATSPGKGQGSPHPMLSNSIAIMVAQYPTHACVAQTLLLRGHVLAACSTSSSDDSSLLNQAVQHVEMAIAIQRKLLIPDNDDLARPLIFLAKLKTQLGHYEEADAAYREAVFIMMDIRSNIKKNHIERAKKVDNIAEEVSPDCVEYLKTITSEMAHAMYLHGKSYHSQRMHAQAFDCYSHALKVLKKGGVGKDSARMKRIVKSMKNRYSLEKLVTSYWDDMGVI